MPVHSITTTKDSIIIWPSGSEENKVTAIKSDFTGDQSKVEADVKKSLQDNLDNRQLIADLPDDDPDKVSDPGLPYLFWDGSFLVGRSVVVENVKWGENEKPIIRIRSV